MHCLERKGVLRIKRICPSRCEHAMKLKLPIVACLLALVALLNDGQSTAQASRRPSISSQEQLAKLPPEVRLRKLHLVRPDLIQYPICFEVYC